MSAVEFILDCFSSFWDFLFSVSLGDLGLSLGSVLLGFAVISILLDFVVGLYRRE